MFSITSTLKRPEAKDDFQLGANLLELHKTSLAHPLTHPINLCPSQRQLFSLALKGATVTPVFKSGDNTDPSNYRPLPSSRWSPRSQRNGWLHCWQNIWTQAARHLTGCSMVFIATTEKWDGCFCFQFSFFILCMANFLDTIAWVESNLSNGKQQWRAEQLCTNNYETINKIN